MNFLSESLFNSDGNWSHIIDISGSETPISILEKIIIELSPSEIEVFSRESIDSFDDIINSFIASRKYKRTDIAIIGCDILYEFENVFIFLFTQAMRDTGHERRGLSTSFFFQKKYLW